MIAESGRDRRVRGSATSTISRTSRTGPDGFSSAAVTQLKARWGRRVGTLVTGEKLHIACCAKPTWERAPANACQRAVHFVVEGTLARRDGAREFAVERHELPYTARGAPSFARTEIRMRGHHGAGHRGAPLRRDPRERFSTTLPGSKDVELTPSATQYHIEKAFAKAREMRSAARRGRARRQRAHRVGAGGRKARACFAGCLRGQGLGRGGLGARAGASQARQGQSNFFVTLAATAKGKFLPQTGRC